MKWHILLVLELILIGMIIGWCDWQNSEHNKAFPRRYWSHIYHRISSWF